MSTDIQLALPLFTASARPLPKVKLALPSNLVDVTASARIHGFRCAVAITRSLQEALHPEGDKLAYYETLLGLLEVAHLAFTVGGRPAMSFCFTVAITRPEGEFRRQLYGAFKILYGQPVVVIGTDKNL